MQTAQINRMKYCAQPFCGAIVTRGRCPLHTKTEHDRKNANIRRWYRSPRWRALRAWKLSTEPQCPGGYGRIFLCGAPTTDVDHIDPHRGNPARFWNPQNLQALCHRCHSAKTGSGA
jgi:5-methylcytosine-specific restriction protein A